MRHEGANLALAIGATISELADQRGLTIKQLGEAAEIRPTQLATMINGDLPFNTDHVVRLARALRVGTSAVLSGVAGDVDAAPVEVDFEDLVDVARREGWAMQGA